MDKEIEEVAVVMEVSKVLVKVFKDSIEVNRGARFNMLSKSASFEELGCWKV